VLALEGSFRRRRNIRFNAFLEESIIGNKELRVLEAIGADDEPSIYMKNWISS